MVNFDIGGEYYGRYDETGRNLGPFVKYHQECAIDAHYTMFGNPQHNGITIRRIPTLLYMVQCMLVNSLLPKF